MAGWKHSKTTNALLWRTAFFTVLGKLPEAQGALGFYLGRLIGRRRGLIEYK